MSDEPTYQQALSIEVKAGQTLALELTARKESTAQPGGFDITVTSATGESVPQIILVGTAGYYRLPLQDNKGRIMGVIPGTYTLALVPPAQGTELSGTVSYPKAT